ncbi:MAG: Crp/Fnr family transcriptional regulator [Terriglobales bacterium]
MHNKQTLGPDQFATNAQPAHLLPGERTNFEGRPIRNGILVALPDSEFQSVRPLLSFEYLPSHTSLHEPGEKLEFVHLPNRGLISLVVVTREGKTVEVGVVGNEGLSGTAALVGLTRYPHRSVVQIAGDGFRIRADVLRSLLPSCPFLQNIASRHLVIQGMQAAQSAACNRLHGIEQRLARWLLMMHDRVETGYLAITHDFLATMLGTDRPSVSLAAALLQRKGAIEYTRGAVRIVSRQLLEESACECYAVIQQFNSFIGLKSPE